MKKEERDSNVLNLRHRENYFKGEEIEGCEVVKFPNRAIRLSDFRIGLGRDGMIGYTAKLVLNEKVVALCVNDGYETSVKPISIQGGAILNTMERNMSGTKLYVDGKEIPLPPKYIAEIMANSYKDSSINAFKGRMNMLKPIEDL
jgi:hypothetical protein